MLEEENNLIKGAKKGNQAYFGHLYDHYTPQIYRFILLKVTEKSVAEDLTHDVFLSAWQNLRKYKPKGFPFSSWLYQIARNKIIDHYRTRKVHSDIDAIDEDLVKVVGVTENDLERTLSMELIQKLIGELGPEQQDVLIMKFVEDLSHDDIAGILGKSVGSVRLIQYRAIQELRKLLKENGSR
ncbi:MAG: sigma-70 family RNA polymerase sigma factor [Patescibacteria group bacterium]